MTEQELNKACEIVRDLANEYFGDWEQSCKFEDKFCNAMEAVIKYSLNPVQNDAEAVIKENLTTGLTWQDIQKIADIIGHTSRLTRDGMTRSPKEFYSEILRRFKKEESK